MAALLISLQLFMKKTDLLQGTRLGNGGQPGLPEFGVY
jgi:hypothetical protein